MAAATIDRRHEPPPIAPRLEHCGEDEVDASWSTDALPPYRSWAHTLYHVLAGSAAIELGGRWATVRAGTICLLPGHHMVRRRTSGMRHRWVNFRVDPLSLDLQLGRDGRVHAWPASACQPWVEALAAAPRIAARRRGELVDDGRRDRLLIVGVLVQACAYLLPPTSAPPPAVDDALHRALRYLDEHYLRNPSLDEVAAIARRSPAHLQRSFAAVFGCSPAVYARTRRMQDARHLLTTTTQTVQTIARRCGYDDQFHFSRVFRRHFGLSPSEARARATRP